MNEVSDAELVKEAQRGNEQALEVIYRRYEASLFYTAMRITNNKEDARDALQDTFIQVCKSIHTVKRPEYLKLWMNRIITGKCRDIYRKKKTITIDMDDFKFQNQYAESKIEYVPEKNLRFQTDKEVVDYFISKLPYPQREAIILAYFQNLTMQEIADVVDEPIGTIKSRIHLAKKALKQDIRSYEEREQVKVDFRFSSLHAILAGSMVANCGMSNPMNPGRAPMHFSSVSTLLQTTLGKVIIAAMLTASAGGAYVYHQTKREVSLKQPSYAPSSSLMLEGQMISSDHEAYFVLMNWAMNEKQMQTKSEDELNSYRPIYEYLKTRNSNYYKALTQNGMAATLEEFF